MMQIKLGTHYNEMLKTVKWFDKHDWYGFKRQALQQKKITCENA